MPPRRTQINSSIQEPGVLDSWLGSAPSFVITIQKDFSPCPNFLFRRTELEITFISCVEKNPSVTTVRSLERHYLQGRDAFPAPPASQHLVLEGCLPSRGLQGGRRKSPARRRLLPSLLCLPTVSYTVMFFLPFICHTGMSFISLSIYEPLGTSVLIIFVFLASSRDLWDVVRAPLCALNYKIIPCQSYIYTYQPSSPCFQGTNGSGLGFQKETCSE